MGAELQSIEPMKRTLLVIAAAVSLLLLTPLAGRRKPVHIRLHPTPSSEPDVRRAMPALLMAADDGAEPLRLGVNMFAPRILKKVAPEYTLEAIETRHEGSVLLDVIVGKDGSIKDVTVRRPLGMGLDERAVDAVSQWKFAPARLKSNNAAVEVKVTIGFGFWLK
jgi:TonB family protein